MADTIPLPYQCWLAWQGHAAEVNAWSRAADSGMLGGGYLTKDAQNSEIVFYRWYDAQTYKFSSVHLTGPARGIAHIRLDDADVGTIDTYTAGNVSNVYAEVTGLAPTVGAKKFSLKNATKHASSTGYELHLQSWAWIMTSTPATPSGTFEETPGYTIPIVPWAGVKASTGITSRSVASGKLGMGMLDGDNSNQNNEATWPLWMAVGTYKLAQVHMTATMAGIYTWSFAGTTLGTIDGYDATGADNVYSEVTGIARATAGIGDLRALMATKNASSTGYRFRVQSITPIRTGA